MLDLVTFFIYVDFQILLLQKHTGIELEDAFCSYVSLQVLVINVTPQKNKASLLHVLILLVYPDQ